jgi:DNA-binding NarL/FixJ family response regulator
MTIRILLVDDQPLLRVGFRMVLEAQPDMKVVGEAGDGLEAVTKANELEPDIVLMDVRMPRMDGIEATREIISSGSSARVLILTTFDIDEYAFAGLRAGASGFLLKDVSPADLLSAIRAVASGDAALSPRVTRRLLETVGDRLPSRSGPNNSDERLARLTTREREVLVEVANGLTNREIAERLYLSEPTVKTHLNRILAKLDLRDRVQAVIFCYDARLVMPSDGS